MQYTKALEEIRKFKNAKKQEEKELGLQLATLEEQLSTANRLRDELSGCESTAAELKCAPPGAIWPGCARLPLSRARARRAAQEPGGWPSGQD